jgi:hypothetical protein
MKISGSIILMVACSLLVSGCSSGRIVVPLRFCVVKGASLTAQQDGSFSDLGNDKIDALVQQTVKDLNTKVWIPGANIQFYTAIYDTRGLPGPAFNVPVIADPQPPAPLGQKPDFIKTGPGRLGDIDVGDPGFQFETQEMRDAHQSCLNAWSLGKNSQKTGTPVIIARALVDDIGQVSGSLGVNPGHFDTVQRNHGDDLCVVPRHLVVGDVANQYVVIPEPSHLSEGAYYHVPAHELGHSLLLSHGDGQNNGGTLPPSSGRRKFDQDCGGGNIGQSLMSPAGGSDVITVLQQELARDAASLVPGHTGPN